MREDRFTGKTAFITGAGRGMGYQVALDMAKEGAKLVVSDVDDEALASADETLTRQGFPVLALKCDVSSRKQVDEAIDRTIAEYGRLDILINNAGLLKSFLIEDTSDELIDKTLDVNVKGILYAIRKAAPIMKKQKYGRIINVASITGKSGDNSTTFVYGASKGAVISLTRSVARQLGPFGITCNAIAPHAVMTKMMEYWDDAKKEETAGKIPVRRLGTIQDMSYLMMYLASDEAGFVNGETVNINGGYYMD
ncbi:MAG: SDR family oxidoreductase [Treponema sp.]|nr:SDR family oxidoreductase [Treponema sp.]